MANMKIDLCNDVAKTIIDNFDVKNKFVTKELLIDAMSVLIHRELCDYTIVKTEDLLK